MRRLSKRQVLLLHNQLLSQAGGLPGLRDEGLLESALNAPFQSFGEVSAYPSLPQKAARLGYAMLVFLTINGTELVYTQEELSSVILAVASGEKGYEDLLRWLVEHQQE